MATGPEHYRKAETLLSKIADYLEEDREDAAGIGEWAAIAQVHATLALAAATALSHDLDAVNRYVWHKTAGEAAKPKPAQ